MIKSFEQLLTEALIPLGAAIKPSRRVVLTDEVRPRGGKKSRRKTARVWKKA